MSSDREKEAKIAQLTLIGNLGLALIALAGVFFAVSVTFTGINLSTQQGDASLAISSISTSTAQITLLVTLNHSNSSTSRSALKNLTIGDKETVNLLNSTITKLNTINNNTMPVFFYFEVVAVILGMILFGYSLLELNKLK